MIADALDNQTTTDVEQPLPDGIMCLPGAVKECTPDGRSQVACRADGMGWESQLCVSDSGDTTQCVEGACLACIPHKQRCRDDDTVEVCGETGQDWLAGMDCNGAVTGQICSQGTCVALCEINVKLNSYMGCEYWGADLDNGFVPGPNGGALDAAGAQYAIIVSNPSDKYPAGVEIHDSDGPVTHDSLGLPFPAGKIPPRELRVFPMPRRDVNGTVQAPLAYRVTTSIPTVVYQLNPYENVDVFSNDASLLLPAHVLDEWYYVMTRMQTFLGIRGYLTVIGISPDTEITVTVAARTLAGEGIPALQPGETISRTLQPFDVLNLETDGLGEDLTGSLVLAQKRVAVFGGSEGANAPDTGRCDTDAGVCEQDGETPCVDNGDCNEFITCCADHIEQELFPVSTWGKAYPCARSKQRGNETEIWRILAAADNTVISTIPPQANIPVLDAGEWFEFESLGDFDLESSKPVMVGQFLASEHAPHPGKQAGDAGIGDPAFTLVPPAEQLRSDYVVLTPGNYVEDFINVVAPLGAEIMFDGAVIPFESYEPIGAGDWAVARLPVEDGVHTAAASDEGIVFGLMVYGFDQYVSYAYPGGMDFQRFDMLKPPSPFGE
ncbi:MAG: hypothetical protein ACI9WU_002778 [Myxococcota bacterium]|jgi:hypothetical protein